ncbi:InlB B-repeat-containing protein, partial [Escherichia coli]|uniref:InlB B-repeat-containing protein n=1 Tax=Escherichia coli TaxID=562 RepID=UPI00345A899A
GLSCSTLSNDGCSISVTQNTAVTLTATAASGSTFAGWGGACTGTGTSVTVTVSDDTSCTVSFTKPTATGQTVQPQTGWWWSANEPGRGYSIEARNN